MKNKTNKKMSSAIIALLFMVSAISIVAMPMKADDYTPTADSTVMGALASSKEIEIGDSITLQIWINSDADDGLQGFKFNFFNWTQGIFEATNGEAIDVDSEWDQFWDGGTAYNNTGSLQLAQGGKSSAITTGENLTACNITFVSKEVGVCHFTFNDTEIYDKLAGNLVFSTINETVTVYPQDPASLGAVAYNTTAINLTFTPGTGGLNVTLCGKEGSYPTGPTDNVIYNGSDNTYNWSGLKNCTRYYFRAWTWNDTASLHSTYYRQTTATTKCDTNFTFGGQNPADSSRTTNCTYSVPLNITITNNGGHSCRWYINTTDGDSWTGTGLLNTSTPVRTMTGLSHNTTYWWNVTAIAGSDKGYSNQSFTTGWGGGTRPTATNPTPTSGSSSIAINPATFSVDIADAEGDPVESVSFYWLNGTRFGKDTSVTVPGTASVSGPAYTLDYATTYSWYATVDDGCTNATSATFTFTTDTRSMTITKEWVAHAGNSTVQAWINVTNNGQANLPAITINDSIDTNLQYNTSHPVATHSGADFVSWENASLNTSKSYNIVVWFNVTNFRLANNTAINNGANVTEGNVTYTATSPSAFRYKYRIDKSANLTTLKWNTTCVNYTINVTNNGDFTLHNVTVNDSAPNNMTYRLHSGGVANSTNESFMIGDIAPGATATLYIEYNTSYKTAGKMLINSTRIYNNVTAITNETSEISKNTYLHVGAITTMIRIRYDSHLTNVEDTGETVLNILGILLIIGSILLIIYIVNKYNLFGGGE